MEGLKEEANKFPLLSSKDREVTAPVTEQAVRLQLEMILRNSLFSQSRRLSRFLRFVVEQSLAGHAEELKERTLAVEVFDRAPAYDSASDPIVRVAAGDLRKRLAQYYVQEAHTAELHIKLPPGGYRPLFEWAIPPPETQVPFAELRAPRDIDTSTRSPIAGTAVTTIPETARRLTASLRGGYAALALCVLMALTWELYAATHRAERGLHAFWDPLSSHPQAIMCVGDFDPQLLTNLQQDERDSFARMLGSRSMVGPGNLTALTRISGLLGAFGKPASVAMADTVSLTDLRATPAVMIGIFENPWTARLLSGERFQFVEAPRPDHFFWLKDTTQPAQTEWRLDGTVPLPALQRDYALISRVHSSLTGQVDYVVGGISPYGTIAASEFITQPQYFEQFIEVAPHGWEKKDVQIVLSTDLVNGRSAAPRMIAYSVH